MYVCNTFTPQIKGSSSATCITDVPQLAVLCNLSTILVIDNTCG